MVYSMLVDISAFAHASGEGHAHKARSHTTKAQQPQARIENHALRMALSISALGLRSGANTLHIQPIPVEWMWVSVACRVLLGIANGVVNHDS